MQETEITKLGTKRYKDIDIELSCRKGGIGRADYGYKLLPSGMWDTGFGTKRGAFEAAKQAIEIRMEQ